MHIKNLSGVLLYVAMLWTSWIQADVTLGASYNVDSSWTTGYQVTVTLTNPSTQDTSSWEASFALPAGESITSFWNGNQSATGQQIAVTNPSWIGGGVIPANGSVTFGMVISSGANGPTELNNLIAVANGSVPPPPPVVLSAPTLNAIDNPTGANSYLLSWTSVPNAAGYTVQESSSQGFSNSYSIYTGPGLNFSVTGEPVGTYYYRVLAYAGSTQSSPSNIVSTTVVQSAPPTTAPIIIGYWESWNSTDSISTIVGMHSNVIAIAFGTFTTTGTNTFVVSGIDSDPATMSQLVTAAHQAGKKVVLSIGGATYPISPQLQTTADAVGMAQAVATFVQANNLDGVDYDIEDYPTPPLQIALLENTRQLLGSGGYISYTPKTPASTTYPYEQVIQGGYPYVSYISIMAYDYGPGYTYQSDALALIEMGVPASKIVIGLMPGPDDEGVETTLGDIQTAASFVETQGLGGLMFWDLNRDHENLTGLGVDAATNTAWSALQ